MTKFDDNGDAVQGSYAISTVHIGGLGADGTPLPTVESAVCDVCGAWASHLWTAGKTTATDDSLTDVRISRKMRVLVYTCPTHCDEVGDSLCDEYGSAVNRYEDDPLASKVQQAQDAYFTASKS